MALQFWSWIFIIQTLLIRTGYAHVSHNYEVLARRAVESVFVRGLTNEEKTKNTFAALAVAAGVVLLAIILGLVLLFVRKRRMSKVVEPESGAVPAEKPHWWMVEAKNEKMGLWRLSQRLAGAVPAADSPKSGSGSRIERLKEALKIKKGNAQAILPTHRKLTPSPTGTIDLPFQTNPNIQPRYPDSLERGYRAPIYPVQSPPQIPTVTFTSADGGNPLRRSPSVPPRAIVTQRTTLSRSLARTGLPRSPGGRRRLSRNSFRNPFLPLKDSDAPLKISAPTPATIDPSNPKLNYAISIKEPRAAPAPPGARLPVPSRKATLPALELGEPFGGRRLGLPASPRPSRA
jgi:hypothetical protein